MTAQITENCFVDPVCHMKVTKDSQVPTFSFHSNTYHFCAHSCRKAFMADPEKYLKAGLAKRKGWWGRYLERLNKVTGGKPQCCH